MSLLRPSTITCYHQAFLAVGSLATAVAALVGSTAHADVLFSTFGAGDTYASSGSTVVSGANSIFTQFAEADRFTAGFSGALSQVDVAVNLGFQAPASAGFIDLAIAPNNPATNLPLVASALTLGTIQATSFAPSVLSLATPSPYAFTTGGTYWLILAPHDASTYAAWEAANNAGATATAYMSSTTGGQFQSSTNGANAFRVAATVIPEPSTRVVLLAFAVLFSLGATRRRRRGNASPAPR